MKNIIALHMILIVCSVVVSANASGTYTFNAGNGLGDLPHGYAFTWGIDLTTAPGYVPGCTITSAKLTFDNLYNVDDATNILYIHLMDSEPSGIKSVYDGGYYDQDYFAGQGTKITSLNMTSVPNTVTIDLSSVNGTNFLPTLQTYSSDGLIGFGFDPDCHYYNTGVELTVCYNTPKVPAPAALLLGVIGTGLVGFFRKKSV